MLDAAGNESRRLFGKPLRARAFLVEIVEYGLHVFAANGTDWLPDECAKALIDVVRVRPFGDTV